MSTYNMYDQNDPQRLLLSAEFLDGVNPGELILRLDSQTAGTLWFFESRLAVSNFKILNQSGKDHRAAGVEVDSGTTHQFTLVFDQEAGVSALNTVFRLLLSQDGTTKTLDIPLAFTSQSVSFTNTDQNMWGDIGSPVIGWHEYIPLLGTDFMQWEGGKWVDKSSNGNHYWRAEDIKLLDASYELSSSDLTDSIKKAAQDEIDKFNAAIQGKINEAQKALDGAKGLLNGDLRAWADLVRAEVGDDYAKVRDYFDRLTFADQETKDWAWDLTCVIQRYVVSPILSFLDDGIGLLKNPCDPGDEAWFQTSARAAKMVIEGKDIWEAINEVGRETLNNKKFVFDKLLQELDFLDLVPDDIPSIDAADLYSAMVNVYKGVWSSGSKLVESINKILAVANDLYSKIPASVSDLVNELMGAGKSVISGAGDLFENLNALNKQVIDESANLIKSGFDISANAALTVNADVYGRVGVLLDAELDGGSVDTDVRYDLTSTTLYNRAKDSLTIIPVLVNQIDGTAFDTASPNAYFTAKLLYDVGAAFDIYFDGAIKLGTLVIPLDGDKNKALQFKPAFSTNGTNLQVDLQGFSDPELYEALLSFDLKTLIEKGVDISFGDQIIPYSQVFSSSAAGGQSDQPVEVTDELLLFSLDSTGQLSVLDGVVDINIVDKLSSALSDKISQLTEGIVQSIEVAIPEIRTQGVYVSPEDLLKKYKASPEYLAREIISSGSYDPDSMSAGEIINDYYFDETFRTVSFDQITSIFENATVTVGKEIQKLLGIDWIKQYTDEAGLLKGSNPEQALSTIIQEAAKEYAKNALDLLLKAGDGKYETGEFVIVDLTQGNSDALFHLDALTFNSDDLIQKGEDPNSWANPLKKYTDPDINANTASYGLFVATGESAPIFKIELDIDQVVAVIVSKIINAITGVDIPPELTNPFTASLSLETLLNIAEVDPAVATEIKKYLDFGLTIEKMDYDISSSMGFSQEFTLTVDDLSYRLSFNEVQDASGKPLTQTFKASEHERIDIDNFSDYDVNKDGVVDYTLDIIPTAFLSNDTELGYNIGLDLEFLRVELSSKLKLLGIDIPLADFDIGPVLAIDAEINGLDIDMYESRFAMDVGKLSYANTQAVNQFPVIISNGGDDIASVTVFRNKEIVTEVKASDGDKDALVFSISGGDDRDSFVIDPLSGLLSFTQMPNYLAPSDSDGNNDYIVEVAVSDGRGGKDTQMITVSVTGTEWSWPEAAEDDAPVTTTTVITTPDGRLLEQLSVTPGHVGGTNGQGHGPAITNVPLFFGDRVGGVLATTLALPDGVGVTATGQRTPASNAEALANLTSLIGSVSGLVDADAAAGSKTFLQQLGAATKQGAVIVSSLKLTVSDLNGPPETPIVISGSMGGNGNNPVEVLVIDTRDLPPGSVLELQNIEFAVIIGDNITLRGGQGANIVYAGAGAQNIVLGADDDELHGGDGDDTIGSKGGDDRLFGDAGNDYLVGGSGSDLLDGGEGDDILVGSASDAGQFVATLTASGSLALRFVAENPALADWSEQQWESGFPGASAQDYRFEFLDQDYGRLSDIAYLYQAVAKQLPDLDALNYWGKQALDSHQLAELAFGVYRELVGIQPAALGPEMENLLSWVWGKSTTEWVDIGCSYLSQGGSWSEALLYLARNGSNADALRDAQGNQRIADFRLSDTGWSPAGGDDQLLGGAGNDRLIAGPGNNLLDGGDGLDLVEFFGRIENFSVGLQETLPGVIDLVLKNELTQASNILRNLEAYKIGGQFLGLKVDTPALELDQFKPLEHFVQIVGQVELAADMPTAWL
jgi:Ca2+-binding RTX toxin-like protein